MTDVIRRRVAVVVAAVAVTAVGVVAVYELTDDGERCIESTAVDYGLGAPGPTIPDRVVRC